MAARRAARDERETAADAGAQADGDAIVVDPEIADDARQSLIQLPAEALVPYRGPVPVPQAPERNLITPVGGGIAVVGWAAIIAVTGTSVQWSLNITLPVTLCATFIAIAEYRERKAAARRVQDNPAITCHRRYVRPAADIDPAYRGMWDRAAAAGKRITAADVVKQQLVDSVQVEAMLPLRLWEIADRLARLSEARARHREILHGDTPDDAGVAATVDRQRRVQELAAADVARRVQALETLADLLAKASAATRTEAIATELADLNAIHADLLTGVGETAADVEVAERMAGEAGAIIEQAREAVRRASEAARTLDVPDSASGETTSPARPASPPDPGRPPSAP